MGVDSLSLFPYTVPMSLPKTSAAYPPAMLAALDQAQREGEVIIPTLTPLVLRMQFQGLRGALRKEGKPELADTVIFLIEKNPDRFIIRLRANMPGMSDVEAAINSRPTSAASGKSATEESEASLDRILGLTPK